MNILKTNRNFFFLWSGQAVSEFGNWINYIALNIYIYQLTGSGKMLGIFLVLRFLPSLLFGTLGGIAADRFNRRVIMIICDSLRAVMILVFIFTQNLAVFFILGFLLSSIDKFFTASLGAYIPDIVKNQELLEANSVRKMTSSVVTVAGPALSGILIGLWGYKTIFIIDSATFLFSVISIALISVKAVHEKALHEGKGILQELKEAGAFFLKSRLILVFSIIRMIDAFGSGAYNTALPIISKNLLSSGGKAYGILVAVWGFGAFIGSALTGVLSKKIKKENLFCISVILMAGGMGGVFLLKDIILSSISIFAGGIGDGISGVLFMTTLMEESPQQIRGKIYGTISAAIFTAVAGGMFLSGFFADMTNLIYITGTGSIVIISGAVFGWILLKAGSGRKQ